MLKYSFIEYIYLIDMVSQSYINNEIKQNIKTEELINIYDIKDIQKLSPFAI